MLSFSRFLLLALLVSSGMLVARAQVSEQALTRVMLPRIDMKEADLPSAVEFLKQQTAKVTNGEVNLNVILKLTEEEQGRKITLALTNIPASEAFKYVARLADVELVYEPYALVIRSPEAVTPPASQ